MKERIKCKALAAVIFSFLILFTGCKETTTAKNEFVFENSEAELQIEPKNPLSKEFKTYWYAGQAELSSYELKQARYGEIREGKAMLIYVTEPFLADKQVKADQQAATNIPVLKLNSTKNYFTGIYPYSIMSSSFYPVYDNQHALKVSFSSQEWCGQVYAQLNNKSSFEVSAHSYFENEADQDLKLTKTVLENELWNKIRINPNNLPVGQMKVIPSFEYIRLSHNELKSYDASITLIENDSFSIYTIDYPELKRTLEITFKTEFPYSIEGWTEKQLSGFGKNAKEMTSTATKIKTLMSPYWRQNSNRFSSMRDSLGI